MDFKERITVILDKFEDEEVKQRAKEKLQQIEFNGLKPSTMAGSLLYLVGKEKKITQNRIVMFLRKQGFTTSEITIRSAYKKLISSA